MTVPTFKQIWGIIALIFVVVEGVWLIQDRPSPIIGRLYKRITAEMPASVPSHITSPAQWEEWCTKTMKGQIVPGSSPRKCVW